MFFVSFCKDSDSECRIAKQSLSVMPNASYFRSFQLQRYYKKTIYQPFAATKMHSRPKPPRPKCPKAAAMGEAYFAESHSSPVKSTL